MTVPVVLDLNGTVRDWAWLRAKYGNITYLEAAGYPKFQLIKVEEMEGPQTLIVNTEAENGSPHSGQPVVLSWPSLAQPSQDLPVIPAGSQSCYTSRGVIQKSENGCTGFGLGGGGYSVIRLWVGRTACSCYFALDVLRLSDGHGLAGRPNHMGPCRLTFRIVPAGVTPDPDPEPGAGFGAVGTADCSGCGADGGGAGAVSKALGGIGGTQELGTPDVEPVPGCGWPWLMVCAVAALTSCEARVEAVPVGRADDGLVRLARVAGPLDRVGMS